jgi:hypothetical protein
MHRLFRKLKNSPAMIVAVIAVVFAMSGSAVAAKSLITGKDIKKGSITTQNLSKTTIKSLKGAEGATGPQGATGAQGPQGAPGVPGPVGPAGANGVNGENGAKGDKGDAGAKGGTGAKGEKGDQGAPGTDGTNGTDGADGKSFDPSKVTNATAALFGFTPWYNTSDSGLVSFAGNAIAFDNGGNGISAVNLPIARGTSLSAIGSIKYAQTGRSTLRIEIYRNGGIYQNKGDYTTLYFLPADDGNVNNAFTDGTWTATGAANSDLDGKTWNEILATIGDRAAQDKAIILNASIGTPSSNEDADAPSTSTLTSVTLHLNHAAEAVTYTFGE